MDAALIEALKPGLFGKQRLVMVVIEQEGRAPRLVEHDIKTNMSLARGAITRWAGYNTDCIQGHGVIYKWGWDEDEDPEQTEARWILEEYIPQGTHKDDLPWRKGKK